MEAQLILFFILKSPLGCKEIQLVHPKGNQSWISTGRTDAEVETPILWPPDVKNWHWKRPWCWERLKAGGEGDDRGWDGWIASPTRWTWVWSPGVGDGQGGLACCDSWGHKELDTTEWLNWKTWKYNTDLKNDLEWVKSLSCVRLFGTPWTVAAYHTPLSMGFSRQEYWSGLPFPSPEDLPDPGIEPRSSAL